MPSSSGCARTSSRPGRGCASLPVATCSGAGTESRAFLATNASALACYGNAGFVRATPAEEREFNVDQPREYVWMRYRGDGAAGSDA